jgi:hypothetical protein
MVRGTLVVEVAAGELDAARRAIARAIVLGALGGSRSAAVEGEAVVFDGGRIVLAADGRASYQLAVSEGLRIAQAVGAATFVSVTTALAFAWLPTWALPAGAVAGAAWCAIGIALDRRRQRRAIVAMLKGLRLLLDAG